MCMEMREPTEAEAKALEASTSLKAIVLRNSHALPQSICTWGSFFFEREIGRRVSMVGIAATSAFEDIINASLHNIKGHLLL